MHPALSSTQPNPHLHGHPAATPSVQGVNEQSERGVTKDQREAQRAVSSRERSPLETTPLLARPGAPSPALQHAPQAIANRGAVVSALAVVGSAAVTTVVASACGVSLPIALAGGAAVGTGVGLCAAIALGLAVRLAVRSRLQEIFEVARPENVTKVARPENVTVDHNNQLVQSSNRLTAQVLAQVHKSGENFFFSGLSLLNNLVMVFEGADDDTRATLHSSLGLGELDCSVTPQTLAFLRQGLTEDRPGTLVKMANMLWDSGECTLQQEFVDRIKRLGASQQSGADRAAAAKAINAWAAQSTDSQISKVVTAKELEDMRLAIFDAIYAKGDWLDAFNDKNTYNGTFHQEDGTILQTAMMRKSDVKVLINHGDRYQAVKLPYGKGMASSGRYALALLPRQGCTVADVLRNISEQGFPKEYKITQLSTLELPKCTLKSRISLLPVLEKLGIPADASLTAMANLEMYVHKIIQDGTFTMDEKGTEAAVVTTSLIRERSMRLNNLTFDREFVIAVAEERPHGEDAVLFAGVCGQPAPAPGSRR